MVFEKNEPKQETRFLKSVDANTDRKQAPVDNVVNDLLPGSVTRRYYCQIVTGVLIFQTILLSILAFQHGPNVDEPAHLAAGLHSWQNGQFDIYRVNPPLPRTLASLPVFLCSPSIDELPYLDRPGLRLEWKFGEKFIRMNGGLSSFRYFILARIALIPVCLLGGYICARWAKELYGELAGIFAVTMWGFSPAVLGWGATIGPDVSSAALGVTCFYYFWVWLKHSKASTAVVAGISLGLAVLSKLTWVFLFIILPLLWICWKYDEKPFRREILRAPPSARQVWLIIFLGLYVLNCGYGFHGTLQQLSQYKFISGLLTGNQPTREIGDFGNRFENSITGMLALPFPRDYLIGIDQQRHDFEIGLWSYLRGEWKRGGWWYYYLYALFVKLPAGLLVLSVVSAALALKSSIYRSSWKDELLVITPIAFILFLVSSQTGFNHHSRYLLPAYPFIFIFTSRSALVFQTKRRVLRFIVIAAMCSVIGSSLYSFPNSTGFFNVLAGGSQNGHLHLLSSNIDWGQHVPALRHWLHSRHDIDFVYADLVCGYNPYLIGIHYEPVPEQLVPGWYAVSIENLIREKKYKEIAEQKQYHMLENSICIFQVH